MNGSSAIEVLENDHSLIKNLLNDLVDATQIARRKEILERLKAALTIHNATEENLVYPALQKIAGQKRESEHLYHETAEADVLVFELDTMIQTGDDSDFVAKASRLRDAVYEHIDDEETTAFPELEEKSSEDQSEMLSRAVREFRSAYRFEPES